MISHWSPDLGIFSTKTRQSGCMYAHDGFGQNVLFQDRRYDRIPRPMSDLLPVFNQDVLLLFFPLPFSAVIVFF